MSIATRFTDWPAIAAPLHVYRHCSPALQELTLAMGSRYGTTSLGCHGVRPISGSQKRSTHSWGAAVDLSYAHEPTDEMRQQICGYLVGWSGEWGISAIHDYRGQRIWRAGRTADMGESCTAWWRAQKRDAAGMGQPWGTWVHVEVCLAGWHDARTERARGIAP